MEMADDIDANTEIAHALLFCTNLPSIKVKQNIWFCCGLVVTYDYIYLRQRWLT